MNDSEASAMSERDLLVRIANDSEHTKKSVDKLWKKNDVMNSTMSEVLTTQKAHGKTLDTMSEAVFTGPDALSPRVRVLEKTKSSGSSGFMSAVRMPSRPPSPDSQPVSGTTKMMGGFVTALIAVIGALIASR